MSEPRTAALWRLHGDYVVDREGLVWRVVRDGGMATRADYTGIESIGIELLRSTKGPLTSLNEFVEAAGQAAAPDVDVLARAHNILYERWLREKDDAAQKPMRALTAYFRQRWEKGDQPHEDLMPRRQRTPKKLQSA